ncbi:sulfotransferase family protein [Nocardioides coralli]|uniref:sulfotransferase family protein n=1 Tax=Nocardioides coralli TaxID=2872154 RepID=UPI001CA3E827|nr:sulfotransferase family protein [Nocardioides coralli]QZY30051.1 sulfotransferase family protein [Nocardioides coralli]
MTPTDGSAPPPRVVVVAGSGRSGTSTIAGVLKLVGLRIPPPEIPGNRTNPRGFFEPRWAVDLQTRLLRRASVVLTDSRPAAFADAAEVAGGDDVHGEVTGWLAEHTADGQDLVVKDPRSSWFLPMWARAAEAAGAEPAFLTMLRHPAEVVGSKDKYYKGLNAGETMRHAQTTRVASWLNVALFTEDGTREARRTFVLYNDLLDDWRAVVDRVVAELDLRSAEVSPEAAAEVDDFVDPDLRRVRTSWSDIDCPDEVREMAQEVWDLLVVLARSGGHDAAAQARLDEIRARYVTLYTDAEALAQSSAEHARRAGHRQGRRKALREQERKEPTAPRSAGGVAGLVSRLRGRSRR